MLVPSLRQRDGARVGNELRVALPLDAGSATTANDTSGHGGHGTLAGSAAWDAGRKNGSVLSLRADTSWWATAC